MSAASINPDSAAASPRLLPSMRQRMVWKECRQNLPLLLVFVAVMTFTLALSKFFVQSQPSHPSFGHAVWFPFLWTFTNIFSLTVGVFIFAPEKENRTDQLLSILPISSGFAVWTKLWVGFATIICFALICVLFQLTEIFVLGSRFNDMFIYDSARSPLWATALMAATGVVVAVECFFWGAVCSLYSKRAIFAAVLATGCFIVFSWLLPSVFGAVMGGFTSPKLAMVGLVISKCLVYAIMSFALVHLGRRWLGHTTSTSSQARFFGLGSRSKTSRLTGAAVGQFDVASRGQTRIYSSLIWQSFRQYRSTLTFTSLCVAPVLIGAMLLAASIDDFEFGFAFVASWLGITLVVVSLAGSMFVFMADQQDRNYRFFQQHREFARKLWFSRLLPAGLLSAGCAMALATGFMAVSWEWWDSAGTELIYFRFALNSAVLILSAFAIGQFNSMFIRSGVFNFVSVIAMSCVLFTWIVCLNFLDLKLGFILLTTPVPLGMLAITWWRAPSWLADRNRIRDVVLPWLALAVVSLGVFAAFGYVRVATAPLGNFSYENAKAQYALIDQSRFDVEDDDNAYLARTALLRDASKSLVGFDKLAEAYNLRLFSASIPDRVLKINSNDTGQLEEFVSANQKSLDLIQQAQAYAGTDPILDPRSRSKRQDQNAKLTVLMCSQARLAELEGDLESALEHWLVFKRFNEEYEADSMSGMTCLLHWSEQPGQRPELIKRAIKACEITLSDWLLRSNSRSQARQLDLANWFEEFQSGEMAAETPTEIRVISEGSNDSASRFFTLAYFLPWEMERSRRLAEKSIELSNGLWRNSQGLAADPATNYGGGTGMDVYASFCRDNGFEPNGPYNPMGNTELFSIDNFYQWIEYVTVLKTIQLNRYVQVRMAVNAWKLKHGSYPSRLDDLVPEYFEELPVDVFDGREFGYSPFGEDALVSLTGVGVRRQQTDAAEFDIDRLFYDSMIQPNTPFLLSWSINRQPKRLSGSVQEKPLVAAFDFYDFNTSRGYWGSYSQFPFSYVLGTMDFDQPDSADQAD